MSDDKEARRAAALRANLRRRKAQARARAEALAATADGRDPPKEARPPSSEPQPEEK